MHFFLLDEFRKFNISDFPKQTHLGYTLITLFFPTPPSNQSTLHQNVFVLAEKQCQSVDRLEGEEKKSSDQYVPKMCLLRKITYGEFFEFVREKKIHIFYS